MGIIVLIVVCVIFLLLAESKPIDTNKVRYVEIMQTIDVYKDGYETTGFVIRKTGIKPKTRKKKIHVRTDIKFRVTYTTGKTATIVAQEGSERCDALLRFIEVQNRKMEEQRAVIEPLIISDHSHQSPDIEGTQRQCVSPLSTIAKLPKAEDPIILTEETSSSDEELPQIKEVYSLDKNKVDTATQMDELEETDRRAILSEDSAVKAIPANVVTPEVYTEQQYELSEEDDFFVQIQEEQIVHQTEAPNKYPGGYYGSYYTVGEDIPAGEYVVFSNSSDNTSIKVTPKRHKKERLAFVFSGSCLVTLIEGELFEIANGYAMPIDVVDAIPTYYGSYMLKVGVHVPAGKYLLKQASESRFAIYYVFPDSDINFDGAVDSDAIWGTQEIVLEDGNYVYIENAALEKYD